MDRIRKRFDDLARETDSILRLRHGPTAMVDRVSFVKWQTSARSLLESVFGAGSSVVREFDTPPDLPVSVKLGRASGDVQIFDKQYGVFCSAKEQYEGGYLFNVRNLLHAEVFSDELEQADHFLRLGYKTPAAVIAGVVLETTLRRLCEQTDDVEPGDKLNRVNDDLAKANVYSKMRADQVRAWAKIRNDAAHGNPNEFSDKDVELMIQGIRDFIANQLS